MSLVTLRFYQACFDNTPPCCLLGVRDSGTLERLLPSPDDRDRLLREREGYVLQDPGLINALGDVARKLEQYQTREKRAADAEAFFKLNQAFIKMMLEQATQP